MSAGCSVPTAAAGQKRSGGNAGAIQTRAKAPRDWAIIGVLTSHHAPFPVFPRACVSSGANRIYDTAHPCTYACTGTSIPPILVSISCFLQQGCGVGVWHRFDFCIKIDQDLKIYQSCCSRCCVVVKTGRGPHVGRRVRAHGGQDIDTEPNNILAYFGKQYVFSWLFPLPAHIFHFTPAGAHLLSSDSRLKHKQMHIPQRKKVERWSRCSLNNKVQRKSTG